MHVNVYLTFTEYVNVCILCLFGVFMYVVCVFVLTLWLSHHLSSGGCQHPVRPLSRIHVDVPQELLPWHGFRVHGVLFDHAAHPAQRRPQHPPQSGLPRPAGSDHHHTHPLPELLVQLQSLLYLHTFQNYG